MKKSTEILSIQGHMSGSNGGMYIGVERVPVRNLCTQHADNRHITYLYACSDNMSNPLGEMRIPLLSKRQIDLMIEMLKEAKKTISSKDNQDMDGPWGGTPLWDGKIFKNFEG